MTFFEGLVLANLFISLVLAYKLGKVQSDIEIVYEGLAQAMLELDTTEKTD
jgi:hypothetical protein